MPKGSCWCQKVQYEYSTPPQTLNAVCHCPSCNKITGSAFTTSILVPKPALRITTGAECLKSYSKPQDPTGMPLTIHFCSHCATTLYKEADSDGLKEFYVVFTGTLDREENAMGIDIEVPTQELWVKYRAKWLAALQGAKEWEGFPE